MKYYSAAGTTVAVRTIVNNTDTLPLLGLRQWLLSDHLGSTSVTANQDGTWNSEIRYSAFGEIRSKNGITPTDYRYTGQLDFQPSIGLDYYVARLYDPVLARFVQPDSIVPDPGKAKAFDRYAYVENNPIIHNDPSGHCAICILAVVVVIGVVVLSGDTPRVNPGDAASFTDLVAAGLEHEKHANIVGEGLKSIQDDPSVKDAQKRIVDQIVNDPKYGEKSYSLNYDISANFTANGPSKKWKEAFITGNQAFWMVHTAPISATNTIVAADGTISTTWHIHDDFDFIPGPNHSDEYNNWASPVHFLYNGIFGAEESYPTDAYWNEIISSQKKKLNPHINYHQGD